MVLSLRLELRGGEKNKYICEMKTKMKKRNFIVLGLFKILFECLNLTGTYLRGTLILW